MHLVYLIEYSAVIRISKKILRSDLEESGYQSALTRSQSSQYGTGWLYHDSESIASTSSCDDWGKIFTQFFLSNK
ncbi:hypothetical protein D917_09742 [Trichinella nativa]|uniref:Uncharacterized protein n=1 Tax=Trichinella nativa TaxID=6335 RepID=A0A1Y3EFK4_9BILA|nr:hypothetical protein D917_09742 [Trichinella nativa]